MTLHDSSLLRKRHLRTSSSPGLWPQHFPVTQAGLLLLLHLAISSCSNGLGAFCHQKADCQAGLRCTATPGKRGVCAYPEEVSDSAIKTERKLNSSDAQQLDGKTVDVNKMDLTDLDLMDQSIPDAIPLDQRIKDAIPIDKNQSGEQILSDSQASE